MQSADFKLQDPLMDGEEEELVTIITWHRRSENHDEEPAEDAVATSEKPSSKKLDLPPPPRFHSYKHSKKLHNGIVHLPLDIEGDNLTPLRIFSLFFNDRMLDCIVENTNMYTMAHKAGEEGRTWKNIDRNDLVLWIAIVIYQGVHREPSVTDHWSRDPTAPEHPISRHMSLSRFEKIKRYIHVSPHDESNEQYFHKIEPLMSQIRDTSKKLYTPKSNVSIDEMMVQFLGRSAHTVKIKNKPIPEDYKILSFCDEGYTYTFMPTSRITKTHTEGVDGVN